MDLEDFKEDVAFGCFVILASIVVVPLAAGLLWLFFWVFAWLVTNTGLWP